MKIQEFREYSQSESRNKWKRQYMIANIDRKVTLKLDRQWNRQTDRQTQDIKPSHTSGVNSKTDKQKRQIDIGRDINSFS